MPGYTVPEFRRKAVIIATGGVYDPRIHLEDVVMPVLRKWRDLERDDFTGEGARLRDELAVLIQELEETCVKFEDAKQRKLERDAKLAEKRAAKALAGAAIVATQQTPTTGAADRVTDPPQPGRLGADGRRHQRRVPDAVPELELARAGTVSGLYVREMVTARALVERHPVTMHMTTSRTPKSRPDPCSSTPSTRPPPTRQRG